MKRARESPEETEYPKRLVQSMLTTATEIVDAAVDHWRTVPLQIKKCMGYDENDALSLPVGPITLPMVGVDASFRLSQQQSITNEQITC